MQNIDDKKVLSIIKNEGKLQAVQFVRSEAGTGLREAKEYVDRLSGDQGGESRVSYSIMTENDRPAYYKSENGIKSRVDRRDVPAELLNRFERPQSAEGDQSAQPVPQKMNIVLRLLVSVVLLSVSAVAMFFMMRWDGLALFNKIAWTIGWGLASAVSAIVAVFLWIPIGKLRTMPDGPKKLFAILGIVMLTISLIFFMFYIWILIMSSLNWLA